MQLNIYSGRFMSVDIDKFITKYGGWTESYFFYDGTVELRYDPKDHVYLLVTGDDLEVQSGVTNVCHVIDKSEALLPWACKMMAQKLLATTPYAPMGDGDTYTVPMRMADHEKLVMDAKSAHKEKLEAAGIIGNIAHNWIESYIKALLANNESSTRDILANLPHDERAKNCCKAALDWMSQHGVVWISTEKKVYSRRHKYAGTMDGLCYVSSCGDPACCPEPFLDRLSVADWKSSNYLYMEYMLQTAAYQAAYMEEHGAEIEDRWVIRLGKDDGDFEPWHMESNCLDEDFDGFLECLKLTRTIASIKGRIKAKEQAKRAVKRSAKQAAKLAKKEVANSEKARIKAEKASTKASLLALKCKGFATYKATRAPRCNKGNPCESCRTKYAEKQATRLETDLRKAMSHTMKLRLDAERSLQPDTVTPNRVQCRICHDIIESTHVHDFVVCKGGHIFVDGGDDYHRSGYLMDGVTLDDIVYLDDEIKEAA